MFFDGITPTPPVIPIEYNLSTGCAETVTIPASSIDVGDITLCGNIYAINQLFTDQTALITFLNTVFTPSFGLSGTFSIDTNQLIYTTVDSCAGTNCIAIIQELQTDDGTPLTDDDGNQLIID